MHGYAKQYLSIFVKIYFQFSLLNILNFFLNFSKSFKNILKFEENHLEEKNRHLRIYVYEYKMIKSYK